MAEKNNRTLFMPFGPSIGKTTIPEDLVNKINNYVEELIKDKLKAKNQDVGANLAGNVTQEFDLDKKWTRKYHHHDPKKRSFGAKVVVTLKNRKKIKEELDKADAHPYGARPFKRKNYINKFLILTKNIISKKESDRFLEIVQNLRRLKGGGLYKLNIEVSKKYLKKNKFLFSNLIFEHSGSTLING